MFFFQFIIFYENISSDVYTVSDVFNAIHCRLAKMLLLSLCDVSTHSLSYFGTGNT